MEGACEITKPSPVRTAKREANLALSRPRVLPLLISSLLFLMLVAIAAYCFVQFLVFLTVFFVTDPVAAAVTELCLIVVEVLLLISLVMPVWLGKLRLTGLLSVGEAPPLSSLFYYFTSRERYLRAWRTSALCALLLFLPLLAILGLFLGAVSVYGEVLIFYLSGPEAMLLLYFLLLVALVFSLSILYFSGAYLFFAAVCVGNENMRVRDAFVTSVRAGRKNLCAVFLFSLRSLALLALSLLTVGVLWVLWFSHHFNLSYMRLAMALCPKEEAI